MAGKVAAGYLPSPATAVAAVQDPGRHARLRRRRVACRLQPPAAVGLRSLWLVCAAALALHAPGAAEAARPERGVRTVKSARPRARPKRRPAPRPPATATIPARSAGATWSRNSGLLADRAVREVQAAGLAGDEAIDAAVDHLMQIARLRHIDVTLSVGNLRGERRSIASRFAFVPFDPSSNSALVTAAHALDQLGPGYRFETPFRTDWRGNLYVEGSFDPTIDDAALLEAARAIRASGVKKLRGDLVIDRGRLDGDAAPAGRDTFGDARWAHLGTPSPFAVDKGMTRVAGKPPRPGRPPRDLLMASPDPMAEIGDRMRRALTAAGVTWTGGVREGSAPRRARERFRRRSAPLAEILGDTLARSTPFDAEMLALAAASKRRGGAPVSVADGAADLGRFLHERVGLAVFEREFRLDNASGLGGANVMTSDNVLSVLRFAAEGARTRPLLDALATPGQRGTLRARLRGSAAEGRLRAMVANDGAAQALSGVIDGVRGREAVAFSAIAKGGSRADVAAWLDALAITLARIEPRAPRPGPVDRASWPAVPDGLPELETTFGRPGEHLVSHRLRLGPGGSLVTVRLNRKVIAVMEGVLADAADQGLLEHIREFGGSYSLRTQRRPDGTELTPRRYSTHSYGVSFDLNPDEQGGDVHPALGEHFQKYGFVWGKFFANNYDPMHFQYVKGY